MLRLGHRRHISGRLVTVLGVERVRIGADAHIGHFNVFRNLRSVEIGDRAEVGQWNWFTCATPLLEAGAGRGGTLSLDSDSAVTSRHYLDCSGGIRLGEFSLVAGVRSSLLTHGIDVTESRQTTASIEIGRYCPPELKRSCRARGRHHTPLCIVMGAVVASNLDESGRLYAGVPAVARASISGRFFERPIGRVDSWSHAEFGWDR